MSDPETSSDGDGIIGYTEVRIGQRVVTVPIRIVTAEQRKFSESLKRVFEKWDGVLKRLADT